MHARKGWIILGVLALAVPLAMRWFSTGVAADASHGRLLAKSAIVDWQSPETDASRKTLAQENARFEVFNVGSGPVKVLSVSSGCGCAKPTITPALIPPGSSAVVDVVADPLEMGGKTVPITLETDSPETPSVQLMLNIHGRKRPPFVSGARGDFFYRSGYAADEVHELVVEVIEPTDGKHSLPRLSCDLPFLAFGDAKTTHYLYGPERDMSLYIYQVPVRIVGTTPSNAFRGAIKVDDPYIAERTLSVPVIGESNPLVKVVPTLLALEVDAKGNRASSARFLVRANRTKLPVIVSCEGDAEGYLHIKKLPVGDEAIAVPYEVSWNPEAPVEEGTYRINARVGERETDGATVTVRVRRRREGP